MRHDFDPHARECALDDQSFARTFATAMIEQGLEPTVKTVSRWRAEGFFSHDEMVDILTEYDRQIRERDHGKE